MKYALLAVIAALSVAGAIIPAPDPVSPEPSVSGDRPAVAVCTIQEGRGRSTDVAILSTANGPAQIGLFTNGATAGSLATSTGSSGSTVIPVGDIAAVGTVGGLIELPNATSTAGVVVAGAASFSAEACQSVPSPDTFLTGGSTVSGESFAVQIMNPYSGEATVSLRVTSEAGLESNERFNSILIPPRSSEVISFNELIPGREQLSVAIQTQRGRVMAVALQEIEGETSLWTAIPEAQDWFLPVPEGQPSRHILIGTSSAIDVDYQVDFYGPGGLEEGLVSGVLPANGQAFIDLDQMSEETSAVRVIATAPVVPTLRIRTPVGLATTSASSVQANRWMLPSASVPEGGQARMVIFNASIEDSTVSIRPLRQNSSIRDLLVPSDGVAELALQSADGYLVESTAPVVVMWVATSPVGGSAAMGVPLDAPGDG